MSITWKLINIWETFGWVSDFDGDIRVELLIKLSDLSDTVQLYNEKSRRPSHSWSPTIPFQVSVPLLSRKEAFLIEVLFISVVLTLSIILLLTKGKGDPILQTFFLTKKRKRKMGFTYYLHIVFFFQYHQPIGLFFSKPFDLYGRNSPDCIVYNLFNPKISCDLLLSLCSYLG